MQTTQKPIQEVNCNRYKYTHWLGQKKVYCKGMVKLYPSVANDYIQGKCDICGYSKGLKHRRPN